MMKLGYVFTGAAIIHMYGSWRYHPMSLLREEVYVNSHSWYVVVVVADILA